MYVCGECKNDAIEIENDPGTQQCVKRTCIKGFWQVETPCAENSCKIDKVNNTFECGDCVNNKYYCSGNDQYVCQDASRKLHTSCTQCTESGCYKQCNSANTCSNDSATKVGILCKSNLTTTPCIGVSCSSNACGVCLNDKVEYREASSKCSKYTCTGGQWSPTACSNGVSCRVANNTYSGCGECTNGQKRYNQASNNHCYYHTCQSGTYQSLTYCSGNVSCTGTSGNYKGCGECSNGQRSYSLSGTTCSYKTCTNGVYQNLVTCPNSNSCKKTGNTYSACGDCKNGQKTFSLSGTTCSYRTCANGVYQSAVTCPNSYSCKKSGNTYSACGDCKNGTTKCANGYKYTCSNGVWGSASKCAKGCKNATTCN